MLVVAINIWSPIVGVLMAKRMKITPDALINQFVSRRFIKEIVASYEN